MVNENILEKEIIVSHFDAPIFNFLFRVSLITGVFIKDLVNFVLAT